MLYFNLLTFYTGGWGGGGVSTFVKTKILLYWGRWWLGVLECQFFFYKSLLVRGED